MTILTVNDIREIVKRVGIKDVFLDLIEEMKNDFKAWETFHKSPRHAIHYPAGVIELMPIADDHYYSFKYVNGHPGNPKLNKPTVMATGQLSDSATGEPLLYSEMTLLTAIRTASASALAGEYLISPNADTMAIIGTGSQSEFQALAFHFHNKIKTIRYYDLDPEAMEKFNANLQSYDLELIPCQSGEEALAGAQVITTLTAAKVKSKVITQDQLQPGVFINGVGGDCPGKTEFDEEILRRSKVVVEYLPQSLIEGEIQNIGEEVVYAELWELVTGKKPGRNSDSEITFFDSVGIALEDYSTLKLFYRYSQEQGIGVDLEMIPPILSSGDPKNIFNNFVS